MGVIDSVTGFVATAGKNVFETIVDAVDRFVHTRDEAEQVKRELRKLEADYRESEQRFRVQLQQQLLAREREIERTIRDEMNARKSVMLAELNQGDRYTRRARPTIIYAGLVLIGLELFGLRPLILGMIGASPSVIDGSNSIFTSFLYVWGAVAGVYTIGRSSEKLGAVRRQVQGQS